MKLKNLVIFAVIYAMFLSLCGCGHVHDYKETVITEPTCTSDGLSEFKCECGESYTEKTKKEHEYESNLIKEPTCQKTGQMEYKCKSCGDTYTEVVEKSSHTYGSNKYCTVCGAKKVGSVKLPSTSYGNTYDYIRYGTVVSTCKITDLSYEWKYNTLTLYITGKKIYDYAGDTGDNVCSLLFIMYDSHGNIICSDQLMTQHVIVNETFKYYYVPTPTVLLDETEDYRIEFRDYTV
ncbi:MAG: hypothetical protein IJL87_02535 [Clostridia bacterium]|nr:hypothetical protein [Clostridia bacterium]